MNRLILFTIVALFAVTAGILIWMQQQNVQFVPDGTAVAAAPLVSVTVPQLSDTAVEGQRRFEQFCQRCHGENAAGQDGIAPPLVHLIYEPSHHADGAFYSAALIGARQHHWTFGDMPPVEGITEFELAQIISYVRELQRANGIE